MRGTIRNNTSQFQRFTPGILQDHCDALGSVRRVTNENGQNKWKTHYYPFGEMFQTQGSGNTHTFTGKEWDAEMSLNYFCQRYYDPEIGRFVTLDTWTNLPDDERLLSYQKYMSWDNYLLEYDQKGTYDISSYYTKYKNKNFAYDMLESALIPIKPRLPILSNDLHINLYPNNLMDYGKRIPRYFAYNHRLNGYLYCMNNPLKYVDPTGNVFDFNDWTWDKWLGGVCAFALGQMLLPNAGGLGGLLASLAWDLGWDYMVGWANEFWDKFLDPSWEPDFYVW
jgi:RHS repeat-associated protein